MLAVVDTNVWVSAFLKPDGVPGQVLGAVRSGRLIPVYSLQVEAEYRDVLSRAKFNIEPVFLAEFFARLQEDGRRVVPAGACPTDLPDPDDAPFIAAALVVNCPIVTGNARHFPAECGVEILSPADCLARLMG